jgi:hypothetical protein
MEAMLPDVPKRFTFGWLIVCTLVGLVVWGPTVGHGWIIEEVATLRGLWYGLTAGFWIDLLWNSRIANYRWPTVWVICFTMLTSLAVLSCGWGVEALILW